MKPKISPEEYRNILKAVDLKAIYLTDLNAKYVDENTTNHLTLLVKEKGSFIQEGTLLKVIYKCKLTATDQDKTDASLSIAAEYMVLYTIQGEIKITEDFFGIFKEFVISMTVWPYFRELVTNTIYRTNLPPLVLPMKKI